METREKSSFSAFLHFQNTSLTVFLSLLVFFFWGTYNFMMKKWLVQTETSDNRVGGDMWEWGWASLPPASASLQPGHELLGCLVLQVGAHVAGVGAVCVPSKQTPAGTHRSDLCTFIFQDCIINKRSCWSSGSLKHNRNHGPKEEANSPVSLWVLQPLDKVLRPPRLEVFTVVVGKGPLWMSLHVGEVTGFSQHRVLIQQPGKNTFRSLLLISLQGPSITSNFQHSQHLIVSQ